MTATPPPSSVRLRSVLGSVPAYTPGKPPEPVEGLTAYKISSNENPFPPLPSVLEAIADAAASVNRYPDMGVTALTAALSERLGVPTTHLATGTGSVAVLGHLIDITCDPGDEVVYAWRSFEAYPIVVALSGATSVQVPLDAEARHDLDAMAAAITDRTRLVLVCTPNNPTGPAVREDELRAFLDKVPSDVLVVIDEAYLEFTTDETVPDALALYRDYPNVAVLRTFSKAYGLAGLRVGYAVAQEEVATALRKAATPFGVTDLAQKAAVASLAAYDELEVRVKEIVAERERVVAALREQGWDVPETQGNFFWLPLGDDALPFAQACQARAITVRPFAGDGVRVSVGETEANDRFVEIAGEWLRSRG
ncbi:histidinol-phosphate transaminase [Ornithinimicrobium humiphilum]|uniref:Aromatic amino acid aminotransferase n=1 Tax=Ornithinimicrobium humiphilum TaxID=125288 RepID=A0A543K800_9MICO|nr:histidinol-phosphate transaminase [Ornithinimicrobium humiphilum]TQM91218.1 histidinol-phosphate aminotransferase [Ornithinimicrobium humiphilum]